MTTTVNALTKGEFAYLLKPKMRRSRLLLAGGFRLAIGALLVSRFQPPLQLRCSRVRETWATSNNVWKNGLVASQAIVCSAQHS